jgi:hypothetical protein
VIGSHWCAMQTAPAPQSASLAQLIVGTHMRVRKSHTEAAGQSESLVQPDAGGMHWPFRQLVGGGQTTLMHGSIGGGDIVGTQTPPMQVEPAGQSLAV